VVSKKEFLEGPKNKSSLIFSVSDTPGALHEALRIFAENNVNMVKLESRPVHSRPWEYLFYVDLEVDIYDEGHRHMLEELQNKTTFLKALGSYRKGTETAH
jgi:3-deoxy-7-phosphoheptulonate synthase